MFKAKQLPTVEANSPKVVCANFNKALLILDKAPIALYHQNHSANNQPNCA
jgi:hypothetical protein